MKEKIEGRPHLPVLLFPLYSSGSTLRSSATAPKAPTFPSPLKSMAAREHGWRKQPRAARGTDAPLDCARRLAPLGNAHSRQRVDRCEARDRLKRRSKTDRRPVDPTWQWSESLRAHAWDLRAARSR